MSISLRFYRPHDRKYAGPPEESWSNFTLITYKRYHFLLLFAWRWVIIRRSIEFRFEGYQKIVVYRIFRLVLKVVKLARRHASK